MRREGGKPGDRGRTARFARAHAHQSRQRRVRGKHRRELRRKRRGHRTRAENRSVLRRRADLRGPRRAQLDPHRQRRQRPPFARGRRRRRRGPGQNQAHRASARNPARNGLCGDRIRQHARDTGSPQPRPRASRAGPRPHQGVRLLRAERVGAGAADRHAGGNPRTGGGGGAQPA